MKIRRITILWLALLAATAISWELGHEFLPGDSRNAGVLILAIAFVKIRFVILDFMAMRIAGEAWVLCVGSLLIALYRF